MLSCPRSVNARSLTLLGLVVLFLAAAVNGWADGAQMFFSDGVQGIGKFPYLSPIASQRDMLINAFTFQMSLFGAVSGSSGAGIKALNLLAMTGVLIGALLIIFNAKYRRPAIMLPWVLMVVITVFAPYNSKLLFYPLATSGLTVGLAGPDAGDYSCSQSKSNSSSSKATLCGFTPQLAAIHIAAILQMTIADIFNSRDWSGLIEMTTSTRGLRGNHKMAASPEWTAKVEDYRKQCSMMNTSWQKLLMHRSGMNTSDSSASGGSTTSASGSAQAIARLGDEWKKNVAWMVNYSGQGVATFPPRAIVLYDDTNYPDSFDSWKDPATLEAYENGLTALYNAVTENGKTVKRNASGSGNNISMKTALQALDDAGFFKAANTTGMGDIVGIGAHAGVYPGFMFEWREKGGTALGTPKDEGAEFRKCYVSYPLLMSGCMDQNMYGPTRQSEYLAKVLGPEANDSDSDQYVDMGSAWQRFTTSHLLQEPAFLNMPVGVKHYMPRTAMTGSVKAPNSDDTYPVGEYKGSAPVVDCDVAGDQLLDEALAWTMGPGGKARELTPLYKKLTDNSHSLAGSLTMEDIYNEDDGPRTQGSTWYESDRKIAKDILTAYNGARKDMLQNKQANGNTGSDPDSRGLSGNENYLAMLQVVFDGIVNSSTTAGGATSEGNAAKASRSIDLDMVGSANLTSIGGWGAVFFGKIVTGIGAWITGPLALAIVYFMTMLVDMSLMLLIILTPIMFFIGLAMPSAASGLLAVTVMGAFILKAVPITLLILNNVGYMIYMMIGASAADDKGVMQDLIIIAMGGLYANVVGLTFFLLFKLGDPQAVLSRFTAIDGSAKQIADRGMAVTVAAASTAATIAAGGGFAAAGAAAMRLGRAAGVSPELMQAAVDTFKGAAPGKEIDKKDGDGGSGSTPTDPNAPTDPNDPNAPQGPEGFDMTNPEDQKLAKQMGERMTPEELLKLKNGETAMSMDGREWHKGDDGFAHVGAAAGSDAIDTSMSSTNSTDNMKAAQDGSEAAVAPDRVSQLEAQQQLMEKNLAEEAAKSSGNIPAPAQQPTPPPNNFQRQQDQQQLGRNESSASAASQGSAETQQSVQQQLEGMRNRAEAAPSAEVPAEMAEVASEQAQIGNEAAQQRPAASRAPAQQPQLPGQPGQQWQQQSQQQAESKFSAGDQDASQRRAAETAQGMAGGAGANGQASLSGDGSGPVEVRVTNDEIKVSSSEKDVQAAAREIEMRKAAEHVANSRSNLEGYIQSKDMPEEARPELVKLRDRMENANSKAEVDDINSEIGRVLEANGTSMTDLRSQEMLRRNANDHVASELTRYAPQYSDIVAKGKAGTKLTEPEEMLKTYYESLGSVDTAMLTMGELARKRGGLDKMQEAIRTRGAADTMPGFWKTVGSGFYGAVSGTSGGLAKIPIIGPALTETVNEFYQAPERARAWNSVGGFGNWSKKNSDAKRMGFYQKEMTPMAAGEQYQELNRLGGFQAQSDIARQTAAEAVAKTRSQYEAMLASQRDLLRGKFEMEIVDANAKKGEFMSPNVLQAEVEKRVNMTMFGTEQPSTNLGVTRPDGTVHYEPLVLKSDFVNTLSAEQMYGLGRFEAADRISSVRQEAMMMQGPALTIKTIKGGSLNADMSLQTDANGRVNIQTEDTRVALTAELLNQFRGDIVNKGLAGKIDDMMITHYGLAEKQYLRGDVEWNRTRNMNRTRDGALAFARSDVSTDYAVAGHIKMIEGKHGHYGRLGQYNKLLELRNTENQMKDGAIQKRLATTDYASLLAELKYTPKFANMSPSEIRATQRGALEKMAKEDLRKLNIVTPIDAIMAEVQGNGERKYIEQINDAPWTKSKVGGKLFNNLTNNVVSYMDEHLTNVNRRVEDGITLQIAGARGKIGDGRKTMATKLLKASGGNPENSGVYNLAAKAFIDELGDNAFIAKSYKTKLENDVEIGGAYMGFTKEDYARARDAARKAVARGYDSAIADDFVEKLNAQLWEGDGNMIFSSTELRNGDEIIDKLEVMHEDAPKNKKGRRS